MKPRRLLVPTDFTDQAQHSLMYSLALARDLQATVYVLYSYYVPINTIETAYIADQGLWLEQAREAALEEMKMLEERLLKKSGVTYECLIHPGPIMGEINSNIREWGIDLLVMGTDESERAGSFFGDLYSQAIRHAQAPVLLVPRGSSYDFPREVVFATDLKPLEKERPLQNLQQMLESLEVKLALLHVHKPGKSLKAAQQQEFEKLRQRFGALQPILVEIEASDIEEGILHYAQARKAHWLMALSHHYGLLEGLFHSSHTKKLARQTHLPLLVSHE